MTVAQDSTGPRTITIRVRRLVISAIVLLVLASAAYAVHWVTGLQSLSAGAGSYGALGMRDPGYNVPFHWTRGGTVE
jgi:hypothetical protein